MLGPVTFVASRGGAVRSHAADVLRQAAAFVGAADPPLELFEPAAVGGT